ncbi:MAG: hypothetical protein ACK5MR_17895, partial [Cumulibacter sp.]
MAQSKGRGRRRRMIARLASATLLGTALAVSTTSAALAAPATVDFVNGAWDGGTGYPLDSEGGTGVTGAVGDLGGGVNVTVSYSEEGTAVAAARDGSTLGNLNLLDGAAIPNLANPGTPVPAQCHTTADLFGNLGTPAYGCHETSGLTLNIESNGANNTGVLANYVRYDFVFSEPVNLPSGITLNDIDSLRVQYPNARPIPYSVNLYQDAAGIEFWTDSVGSPGTGTAPDMTLGANLSSSSIGGLSYVHSTTTPLGGRGGLTNSGDAANQANFAVSGPVSGFTIYYWDRMSDSGFGSLATVFPTVGVQNFEVEPLRASLSLAKEVSSGEAAPTDWTLSADGPTPIEGVTGDTPVTDVEIQPGTYTLTESGGPAGYEQQNLTCTDGEQDLDVQNGVVEIS